MTSIVPTTTQQRMFVECVALEAAALAIEVATKDLRKSFGEVAQEAIAKVEKEAAAGRLGMLRHSWAFGGQS